MPVKIGNDNISKLFLGNTPVTGAYLGESKVYPNIGAKFLNPLVLYKMRRVGNQIMDEIGNRHAEMISLGNGSVAPVFETNGDYHGMIPNHGGYIGGDIAPEFLSGGYSYTVFFKAYRSQYNFGGFCSAGGIGVSASKPGVNFILQHAGIGNRTMFEVFDNRGDGDYQGDWRHKHLYDKIFGNRRYAVTIIYNFEGKIVGCVINGISVGNIYLNNRAFYDLPMKLNFPQFYDSNHRNFMPHIKCYAQMVHSRQLFSNDISRLHNTLLTNYE